MASYAPPTEDTAIFNGLYFTDRPITSSEGDARYLRLLAQGDEDMNDNDILNINQAETNSVKFSDNTIQTTAFTGSVGLPTGSIITFAGSSGLPADYLLCNGNTLLTADYPTLFSIIGYTYGGTGGSFNLPDLTDKFIQGASQNTGSTIGSNEDFINESNIQTFQPTQRPPPNNPSHTTIAFNTSGGIGNWKYMKGEPTGDGSKNQYYPFTSDDNANGDNIVEQLNIGTGTTQFNKIPLSYLMTYIIKT